MHAAVRRPYLTFVSAVVAPSAVALLVAGWLASGAWTDLHRESHARVGRMALSSLEQEIGAGTQRLIARAERVAEPDRGEEAVRRALRGDTVAGLGIVGREIRLSVVLGDPDDPAAVRFGSATLVPTTPDRVGRATGYAVGLYLNGSSWASTEPAAGPERLPEDALPPRREGTPLGEGREAPVAVGMEAPAGTSSPMVAVVRPLRPVVEAMPLPVLLVITLLLVFSALAGWIQLARPARSGVGAPAGRSAMLLLSFVPALTVLGFLVHLERTHREATRDALSRDLGRALALARSQGIVRSPQSVRAISDFHASRLRGGSVEETTYERTPEDLAHLPAPPPSFTSAGRMRGPDGLSVYAGSRLDDGSVMVVSAAIPMERAAALRVRLIAVGAALALWLLGVGVVTGRRRTRRTEAVSPDR